MPESATIIQFSKYHGTGNDFIIIDGSAFTFPAQNNLLIKQLCDRHFGIGADGLIIIEPSGEFDFKMTYFNSDGFEGSMCGNGGRCAVAFAKQMNIISKNHCVFMASDGIHRAEILEQQNDQYMIALGMKDCQPPVKKMSECYFIHTGSPHLVKFVENTSEIDVLNEGKSLRHSPELNPDGANVNFVSSLENRIIVRTYERGVENETLSCGTGVTASAICHAFLNSFQGQQNVETETRGGILELSFNITDEHIKNIVLKGPTVQVFEGVIRIP